MRITKQTKLSAIKANYLKLDIFSVDDIKRKHTGHWFSKYTMRFFSSKVCDTVFCSTTKAYFVSSERKGFIDCNRAFTVRVFDIKTGNINTVGKFLGFETKAQALSHALNCAYNETLGL